MYNTIKKLHGINKSLIILLSFYNNGGWSIRSCPTEEKNELLDLISVTIATITTVAPPSGHAFSISSSPTPTAPPGGTIGTIRSPRGGIPRRSTTTATATHRTPAHAAQPSGGPLWGERGGRALARGGGNNGIGAEKAENLCLKVCLLTLDVLFGKLV